MPPISQLDTPPASPKSPPRKRRKFSLKLKGKNSKTDSETQNNKTCEINDTVTTEKSRFYPIFSKTSTPPRTHSLAEDENCVAFTPTKSVDRIPPPYSGVKNLGNTCYANAVLQVLRHCPGFVDSIASLANDLKKQREVKAKKDQEVEETDADVGSSEQCSSEAESLFVIVSKLDELMCEMSQLEEDYKRNGEKCEQLKPKRDGLVLAAEPVEFMSVFRETNTSFCSYEQHDAQEFLRNLLMNIQDTTKEVAKTSVATIAKASNAKPQVSQMKETSKAPKSSIMHYFTKISTTDENNTNDSSFIEKLFQGRLVSQTKCLTCEEAKRRHEEFQDISVPVQKESLSLNLRKNFSPFSSEKGEKQNLAWAISQFASVEFLNGDNKYFCDSCKTHTEAEIKTCFDVLPEVLTVHLKRFTTTATGCSSMSSWVSKINSNLDTPEALLLDQWCSSSVTSSDNSYELFGIVMHSGMTSCSGHYQAYVKVPNRNKVSPSEDNLSQENVEATVGSHGHGTLQKNGSTNVKATEGSHGNGKLQGNGSTIVQATEGSHGNGTLQENGSTNVKATEGSHGNGKLLGNGSTNVQATEGSHGNGKLQGNGSTNVLVTDEKFDENEITVTQAASHNKDLRKDDFAQFASYNGTKDASNAENPEKVNCLSGITKFSHASTKKPKTAKRCCSTSTRDDCVNEGSVENETAELIKLRRKDGGKDLSKSETNCSKTLGNFKRGTNVQSTRKTQNFQSQGTKIKDTHVRKLEFQHKSVTNETESMHLNEDINNENKENLPSKRSNLKFDSSEDDSIKRNQVLHDEELKSVTHKEYLWVQFDDAVVHILEDSEVARILSSCESAFTSPYLLFYKRSRGQV